MFIVGLFEQSRNWVKCLVLFFVAVFMVCLSTVLTLLTANAFGCGMAVVGTDKEWLEFSQLLQSVLVFVGGAWLSALLLSKKPLDFLYCRRAGGYIVYVFAILIVLLSQPMINLLSYYNTAIPFPSFLEGLRVWMEEMEQQAQDITVLFLSGSGASELVFALFLMALVPAVGEELFFRGALFSVCRKMFKNVHVAIWVSAAIFSFIHFQFFGFVPRAVLGAMFSYMLVWTNSIWVPVTAHFVNNALAVLSYWFMGEEVATADMQDLMGDGSFTFTLIVSTLMLAVCMVFLYRKCND